MTRYQGISVAGVLVLGLACLGGCGSGGGGQATVSGEVTVDGQPLKEGMIRFVPADGKSTPADTTIKDGKFTTTVTPGDKKVEITAPKVVGKMKMYDTPDAKTVDKIEELIPPQFNVESKLTWKVEKGSQEKKFDLKTK